MAIKIILLDMFYYLIITINDNCKELTNIIEKPVDSAYYRQLTGCVHLISCNTTSQSILLPLSQEKGKL